MNTATTRASGAEDTITSLADLGGFRRTVAGGAMILMPILILVAEVLHQPLANHTAGRFAAALAYHDRMYAAHLLLLVAMGLAVPAFLGLVHLLYPARPALADVSFVVFVAGLIGITAFIAMEFDTWQAAVPQADATEMIAFLQRVYTSSGILAISVGALLFPLAWLLAGIGLYRANTLPRWQASLIAAGLLVSFGAELAGAPKAVYIAADVAFVLGLAPLGVRVLGQSGRKWAAHPPAPAAPAAPTVG